MIILFASDCKNSSAQMDVDTSINEHIANECIKQDSQQIENEKEEQLAAVYLNLFEKTEKENT